MYKVILYYKFVSLDANRLEIFCRTHRSKCKELGLLGRVFVAGEGINGTLAGAPGNIEAYKNYLRAIPGFETTDFKEDLCEDIPFERLSVRIRPEIVALKPAKPVAIQKIDGQGYLEPHQWRQALESSDDFVLMDVRNNYESRIGRFKGAITPDVENFFDFPQWLEAARLDKDKKVLMYCTGGIRCEKFSAYMKENGFKNVFQLHGGIINYAQKEGGKHFEGKCFVFDDRMAVPVNPADSGPISRCAISGVPCDTYINCANMECNKLFLCSREAALGMEGCCSEECRKTPRRRPLNIENLYKPFRRWYKYFEQKPLTTTEHC
jgi:UPF0176 protein